MKFNRLRLAGFKSFTDATELYLEPGLTGVVGPNGCGKSNLVEALRWVMGESSYKNMRGSGMDDVIFSGSGNRPARNTAEVTLVLDNQDRTAPAFANNADVLEVSRRIEREAGSAYRVNGREVRARDVQLLFADASTGAHSPALVRQGQIGELIAAKPVQRRALLEEAAGISGLHSRRHEAELRLRAAEQNLERIDDIVAQIESQLDHLKRQARQAVRYRNLSGEIRKAEAGLLHVRWVAARHAEKEAEAAQGKLLEALAEATHAQLEAEKAAETAREALEPLRRADVEAGAVVQRLTIAREQLEEEARRADARRDELQRLVAQLEQDGARDTALISESEAQIARLEAERTELETAIAGAEGSRQDAEKAAGEAQEAHEQAATIVQERSDAVTQLRTERSQLERQIADAEGRVARLDQQLADVMAEAEKITAELARNADLPAREQALADAREKAGRAEEAAVTAEQAAADADTRLNALRPGLNEAEAELARLEAEAKAIARMLNLEARKLWAPLIDQIKVAPGFEAALAAAFGDDLDAASDSGAPAYWDVSGDAAGDPTLPAGAQSLSGHVKAPDLLNRRLAQIGIVSRADGPALARQLQSGQVLVSREGDLWRWDGYVARADAPSAAAQRLAQRNRLAEIEDESADARRLVADRREAITQAGEDLAGARARETEARNGWRTAQQDIGVAQTALDEILKGTAELNSRRSALEEARTRLQSSRDEASAVGADARAAMERLTPTEALEQGLREAQGEALSARERAESARLRLATLQSSAQAQAQRLERIGEEVGSWQRRLTEARHHAEALSGRKAEAATQLAALASQPDGFAERASELQDSIDEAEAARRRANDRLQAAQNDERSASRAAQEANAALGKVREEMARAEERTKSAAQRRIGAAETIRETLEIAPERSAELAGIRPEAPLPRDEDLARRFERLKQERERLGGVNLRAEQEASETQERLDTLVRDREDLIAAISKLRGGIASLNREGRTRLTEAFDKVNANFRQLFTTLFGGGTAELTFVESDDPLEAGLEVIARPPGKKPQTMTLLSGGEQALTALSLIFAVFLTNPAPICVLDEVDAPLDDANVERFCDLLASMRERTDTRFVVITHNPITMSRMDRLFGVTMVEKGVSQLVSVDLSTAEEWREAG